MKPKVLFIIKERKVYNTKTKCYGLFNSCDFVSRKLNEWGIESKTVQVIDNNCIDRQVHQYKPTHCFIEALWVVPEKFEVLAKLHPQVNWVIRLHSMIPFLCSEGIAMEWITKYIKLAEKGIKISVSSNNEKLQNDLNVIFNNKISYTPNIYCPDSTVFSKETFNIKKNKNIVNIGCFGALRILKNHTQQALSAIRFADSIGKELHFHVNVSEHEQIEAGPVLKNLRWIFSNTKHKLVEHLWYNHADFLKLVKEMDLGMQISFTETFNIVAADFAYSNVPILASKDVNWLFPLFKIEPDEESKIQFLLKLIYYGKFINLQYLNKLCLNRHNKKSIFEWLKYFYC